MDYLMFQELRHSDDELAHHGIKGQKWGVRRWQNEDGSLTKAGEARYRKVASSDRLIKRDTRRAKKILRKKLEERDAIVVGTARASERAYKRAEKAEQKGKLEKSAKLHAKGQQYALSSKIHEQIAKNYATEISKINDGTIKAGKDFITRRDVTVLPIPGVATFINVNDTYIRKKG